MNLKERLYDFPATYLKILSKEGIRPSSQFIADYKFLKKEIRERLSKIITRYQIENPGIAYQKYLDVDLWVLECLRRVYNLELHKAKGKLSILDLGTGAGYFPFICNYYGHHAEALDIPDNEMYNQVIQALGIKRFSQYITPFKDLDVPVKYDLITGYMICFNNHKTPEVWHIKEWEYFLKSVCKNQLKPGGALFLSFNAEREDEPIDKRLLDYFKENNANIHDCQIAFKRSDFYTS